MTVDLLYLKVWVKTDDGIVLTIFLGNSQNQLITPIAAVLVIVYSQQGHPQGVRLRLGFGILLV